LSGGYEQVNDPVAGEPVDRELRAHVALAGERLHGIAPELGDAHHRLPNVGTTRRRVGIQRRRSAGPAYGSKSATSIRAVGAASGETLAPGFSTRTLRYFQP